MIYILQHYIGIFSNLKNQYKDENENNVHKVEKIFLLNIFYYFILKIVCKKYFFYMNK